MAVDLFAHLSSQVVAITLGIIIIGVGIRGVGAYLNVGKGAFNFRLTAYSLVLAVFVAIPTVSVVIGGIEPDITTSELLALIATQILAVAGADAVAKKVGVLPKSKAVDVEKA